MKLSFSIYRGLCLLGLCVLTAGAAHAQITVLPLGDSITYGYLSGSDEGSAGYRYQLFEDLGGSASDVTFLGGQSDNGIAGQPQLPASETANEGHNGYTIEGVDAELEGNGNTESGRSGSNNGGYWLTSGTPGGTPLNPQVVLLDLGTNDATDFEGDDAASAASQMDTYIVQLMGDLKTDLPNAQIFVGNLTTRFDNSNASAIEALFNAALPSEVADEGSNFHFVDIDTAVSPSNINLDDGAGGVHPDAAGYAQMGNAWYNAMVSAGVVPEPSTYALMGVGALVLVVIARRRRMA